MTAIGKRGARSSGPIGCCVPGWRTGGGGCGRSAARLYQDVVMASSGKRKRVCSSIAALLHNEDRLAPLPRHPPRDETAPSKIGPLLERAGMVPVAPRPGNGLAILRAAHIDVDDI